MGLLNKSIIKKAKEVKGTDLMIGGGVGVGLGYAAVGVAVLAKSSAIATVGLGAIYIGTGAVITGAVKSIVEELD